MNFSSMRHETPYLDVVAGRHARDGPRQQFLGISCMRKSFRDPIAAQGHRHSLLKDEFSNG
jgi:hypothetical protein